MSTVPRKLSLHASALSDHEYRLYTTSPEEGLTWRKMKRIVMMIVGEREATRRPFGIRGRREGKTKRRSWLRQA